MASGLPMRPLGKQGLHASAQGLGCMSLSKGFYGADQDLGPEADRLAVIQTALARGVTLLNTADFYGPHDNHVLIGELYVAASCMCQWLSGISVHTVSCTDSPCCCQSS